MKALVCNAYGTPNDLVFEDLQRPAPLPHEILIKVKAVGLNYPDSLTIQGKDQYGLSLPFVPGREMSGIVEELGTEVSSFQVGDRVMAQVMEGALQNYCKADASKVYKMPTQMSFTQASVFLMAYGTAYHALVNRAQITSGETLVILGASGGVGSALIQLGKLLGAKIIAITSSEAKATYCKNLGADQTLIYNSESDIKGDLKSLTEGKGADVICDLIGGSYSEQAFRAIAYNGRFLVIGFTSESIGKMPLNLPLLKSASIIGVFWSTFSKRHPEKNRENIHQLIKWFENGEIEPSIFKVFDFANAKIALNQLLEKLVKGNISILIN